MPKYDPDNGVWRTIGGRKVFIKKGQSLSEAMKESGKFKSAKKVEEKDKTNEYQDFDKKMKENIDRINKEYDDEMTKARELGDDKVETEAKEKRLRELKKYEDMRKENLDNYKNYKSTKEERTTRDVQNEYEALSKKMQQDDYYYKAEDDKKLKELRAEYDTRVAKGEKDVNRDDYNKKNEIKDTRATIKNVAKNSKEDNITLDTETGEAVKFDKGYSVSFQQSTDNYSDKEFDEKVNECKNICNGKLYVGKYGGDAEPSFYTDDLSSAKEIMYKYNQESIYDWETDDYIYNEKYDASKNKTNFDANEFEEKKSTNDIMNEKIRTKGKKEVKEDLPKKVEIKEQGTSNRKEVSENIQAHILEFYDDPQDFVEQMENMGEPTMWKAGEKLAQGGSYEIYYDDQREFLNSLKINPKGKEFDDDRVFQTYNSLIGRESARLYDRLKKNAYNKYKREHPLTKMSFEEFKNNRD